MKTFIFNVSGAWCLSVCLFDCGCLILFTVRVEAHFEILDKPISIKAYKNISDVFFVLQPQWEKTVQR